MTQEELAAQQDQQRTGRLFVSLLSGVFGVEQTYAGQDGSAYNYPSQYQTVTPGYGVSVEGRPISNLQGAVVTMPLMLILGAGVLFLVLKK